MAMQVLTGTRKLTILLVEDDEVDRMNVQRAFRKYDIQHHLAEAMDGAHALDLLNGHNGHTMISKPDLILLDINMPRMNGLEFLKALRNSPTLSNVPVVILSTSNESRDIDFAYRYHVAGYIQKPIRGEEFEYTLLQLLRFYELNELP